MVNEVLKGEKRKMRNNEEYKDKCTDCPFNDTGCPGGAWCTIEDDKIGNLC